MYFFLLFFYSPVINTLYRNRQGGSWREPSSYRLRRRSVHQQVAEDNVVLSYLVRHKSKNIPKLLFMCIKKIKYPTFLITSLLRAFTRTMVPRSRLFNFVFILVSIMGLV